MNLWAIPLRLLLTTFLPLVTMLLSGCGRSPVHIIHVANWHWIPKESFAIDLRQSEPDLTDAQIDEKYMTFLDDLEFLQKVQSIRIRNEATKHNFQLGKRAAFYEGVTPDNLKAFAEANSRVKRVHQLESELNSYDGDETAKAEEIRQKLRKLILELREERLQLGAVGQLIREGSFDSVLPLESTATLDAANPVTSEGKIQFDTAAVKAREVEMARRIAVGDPVAIVLLGGDHDLTEALKTTGRPFTYERIETPAYKELANKP